MGDVNLVLSTFSFNPDAPHEVVELRGRSAGIIGFVLHQLGLSQQSYLVITREDVQFRFVSLSGITTILCPLDTITSAFCGVQKPMWALWLGIFLLFFTCPTILPGLIGLVLLYHFYRTKFLTLTFSTGDMMDLHGLDFAAFTRDGKRITVEELLEIVEYLNTVLLNVRPDPIDVTVSDGAEAPLPVKRTPRSLPAPEAVAEEPAPPPVGEIMTKVAGKVGNALGVLARGAKAAGAAGIAVVQQETEKRRQQQSIQKLVDDSVAFFKQRNYTESLRCLREAQALDPNDARITDAISKVEKKMADKTVRVTREMEQLALAVDVEDPEIDHLLADEPPLEAESVVIAQAEAVKASDKTGADGEAVKAAAYSGKRQTGENLVAPGKGVTGALDSDKAVIKEKLREAGVLFQEKQYIEALAVLRDAQRLNPASKSIQDGIDACERKLNAGR